MVGLVEVALGIALRRAQVDEIHPVALPQHHSRQVVRGRHSERTRAEAQPVRRVGDRLDQFLKVGFGGENAGQTEDRERRIVGMDRQHRTRLVGHGSHLAQERHEVRAQRLGRDILVTVQLPLELLQRETLLRAGQARDHVAGDQLFFRGVHPPEAGLGSGALGLGIVLLRAGTLQDEEIEGHERRTLEAQGARPVGQLVGEVRARPVQHGHKVVGNYFNAAFGQIADRLFVILDIALEIARAGLDMLVDGDALHDRPAKARVSDRLSAFFDLPDGPHLAVGNVMEGGHDVGGPGLTDVLKAYGVVRTVPAPGLFAKIHGCIVFRFSNFSHTVLSPLQARMRRFKTASRGDAGILREQANKRCSPLFACSHVRFFTRPKRRNCRERSRPDAGAVKRRPG